ncbi:MAG TPA: dihydropteroate synthase [Polyangiales bacterium]|nr:dihydropteroate synthase [Polyangiales bacterium]
MTERGTGEPSATEAESQAHARSCGSCEVWGILNVTPDSFSDGGAYLRADAALTQGLKMMREGAHVIDVGGESSRPTGKTYGDVEPVSVERELARVIPVIKLLAGYGARLSIDTVKAVVAERAVQWGAQIVNDVSCGRSEALLRVAAESGAELVLMHNRGRGERSAANTQYGPNLLRMVRDELMGAMDRAVTAGVRPEQIWLDPGIGFAKQAVQSAALLARTDVLVATGQRVLVGASRKSFIGELAPLASSGAPDAAQRLGGSLAAITAAVLKGAHAVRVHDVLASRQAVDLALALRQVEP